MTELIDHLADMAGQRDRDLMDHSFLGLIDDLLAPESLVLARIRGEGEKRVWTMLPARRRDPSTRPGHLQPYALLSSHVRSSESGRIVCEPHADGQRTLVPLNTGSEPCGVIELQTDSPLDESATRTLVGIQRFYRHLRALLDENERDAMTGLLNRKSFDEAFVRAAMQVDDANPDSNHWLGVVDVDHFKRVNDRHGHLIGDEVLILIARLMRSTFRFDDGLYRFGGEEFVVLMRAPDASAATAGFEQLRHEVEGFDFPRVGRLTVSIGFTRVEASDLPSAAFERADQAVYFAKANGRNAVHDHAMLVESGAIELKTAAAEESGSTGIEFF
ncbi:MAG: GGDEF domain-containing protein [Burkholderiaceae bacterium]|nr:GGDEF domain-containing protein [Burkholderiaceae bacterium]